MTRVTCRLTAKNRDQLRNPTLGNRYGLAFTILNVGDVLCQRNCQCCDTIRHDAIVTTTPLHRYRQLHHLSACPSVRVSVCMSACSRGTGTLRTPLLFSGLRRVVYLARRAAGGAKYTVYNNNYHFHIFYLSKHQRQRAQATYMPVKSSTVNLSKHVKQCQ